MIIIGKVLQRRLLRVSMRWHFGTFDGNYAGGGRQLLWGAEAVRLLQGILMRIAATVDHKTKWFRLKNLGGLSETRF